MSARITTTSGAVPALLPVPGAARSWFVLACAFCDSAMSPVSHGAVEVKVHTGAGRLRWSFPVCDACHDVVRSGSYRVVLALEPVVEGE